MFGRSMDLQLDFLWVLNLQPKHHFGVLKNLSIIGTVFKAAAFLFGFSKIFSFVWQDKGFVIGLWGVKDASITDDF